MYSLCCWLALLTAEVDQQFINIKYVRAAGEYYELDWTFSIIFISALIRNTVITKKKNVCSIQKFYRQCQWQWYIGPGRINIINVILFIIFLWIVVFSLHSCIRGSNICARTWYWIYRLMKSEKNSPNWLSWRGYELVVGWLH